MLMGYAEGLTARSAPRRICARRSSALLPADLLLSSPMRMGLERFAGSSHFRVWEVLEWAGVQVVAWAAWAACSSCHQ